MAYICLLCPKYISEGQVTAKPRFFWYTCLKYVSWSKPFIKVLCVFKLSFPAYKSNSFSSSSHWAVFFVWFSYLHLILYKTYLHTSFACSWSNKLTSYTKYPDLYFAIYCSKAFLSTLLFESTSLFHARSIPSFSLPVFISQPCFLSRSLCSSVPVSSFHNPIQDYNIFTPTSCVFCQKNYNQTFPNFTINFPPQVLTSNFTPAVHSTDLRVYPSQSAQRYAIRSALYSAVTTILRTASLFGTSVPTCQNTSHLS